ncbi:DUF302 domain-containing protein [Halomonas chromatireducens]|uniref:DUF302 domain-containing protein n=1 Tax=Halomonas chromatireducens TaxID=507626 RepID=A0A0X8HDH0_9GAMM|nr:DUF302 domain-containing protein [Halomonas chromatireducens]AMD00616.1 hypothetical protein LOKO_01548 [Halomonas chromatireducens]
MYKIFPLLGATAFLIALGGAKADDVDKGIEQVTSDDGIDRVEERLRTALDERGMVLVTMVDHSANAERVSLSLPPTRMFLFGNPEVGTPMMQCQGGLALDLPQKMLLREEDGTTLIEWNDPNYLAWRHDLDDCDLPLEQVAEALSGIANQAAGN